MMLLLVAGPRRLRSLAVVAVLLTNFFFVLSRVARRLQAARHADPTIVDVPTVTSECCRWLLLLLLLQG